MADAIKVDTSEVDAWRRKLSGTPAQIDQAMRDATEETGEYAKRLILTNGRSVGISSRGGGLWLRGVGRSGAPIGVDVKITDGGKGFDLKGTGPWQLVEGDTRPHRMPSGNRRRRKPYRTPFGAKSRVNHPGTKGKRIWRKSLPEVRRKYPRFYRDKVVAILNEKT